MPALGLGSWMGAVLCASSSHFFQDMNTILQEGWHDSLDTCVLTTELSGLGSNVDPVINCHPGVSQAGQGTNVCAFHRMDVNLGVSSSSWCMYVKDPMVSFVKIQLSSSRYRQYPDSITNPLRSDLQAASAAPPFVNDAPWSHVVRTKEDNAQGKIFGAYIYTMHWYF